MSSLSKKFYYLKSNKTKIDINFFIDEENIATQACYSMNEIDALEREVGQLKKLDGTAPEKYKLFIITMDDSKTIPLENNKIQVIRLQDFLLQ